MTQAYTHPVAVERMRDGKCPECGKLPEDHGDDPRFWMPINQGCDLLERGVTDRIAWQRELDEVAAP